MTEIKVTEAIMQAVLMHWCMANKHLFILPNSNSFFGTFWESDLISITKSALTHEFEIKISRSDYNRDAKKRKMLFLQNNIHHPDARIPSPNYFWYVTYKFEIEPPEFAGWLLVTNHINTYFPEHWLQINIKKAAPRLHKNKIQEGKIIQLAHLLSWRTTYYFYNEKYLNPKKAILRQDENENFLKETKGI